MTYLKLSIQNIFRNRRQLKEHYAKNYYADSCELSSNEQDNKFLKQFIAFIEANMDQSEMDINQIAGELSMSRSKLYTKVKSLTGKSVVEFVLNCRLRSLFILSDSFNGSFFYALLQKLWVFRQIPF